MDSSMPKADTRNFGWHSLVGPHHVMAPKLCCSLLLQPQPKSNKASAKDANGMNHSESLAAPTYLEQATRTDEMCTLVLSDLPSGWHISSQLPFPTYVSFACCRCAQAIPYAD